MRILPFALLLLLAACGGSPEAPRFTAADSLAVVQENLSFRREADVFFGSDPSSPFAGDSGNAFSGLRWYPVDPAYRVHARLKPLRRPEPVTVFGTKGEERRLLRYAVFTAEIPDGEGGLASVVLNVYKDPNRRGHLSVWFTDETTGRETYPVGRYLEVGEEHPDPAHLYTLDFNRATNPWCAYSDRYSCAVPRREDHLAVALRAGELPYDTTRSH